MGSNQILNPAFEGGELGIVERAKSHDGPRGLRRGAGSLSLENGIIVGVAPFAPAAVGVLDQFQPGLAALEPGLAHVDVQRPDAAQHLPRAINIIHTPPSVPRAIVLLLFLEITQSGLDLGMIDAPALVTEQFKNSRRDVGALGIKHGVVIGERHLFENALGAILVERRPAAVPALKGHHPFHRPGDALVASPGIVGGNLAQGENHHGGVVHVRVPLVVELEDPAGRFHVGGVLVDPVALEPDFLVHQPFGSLLDFGMPGRHT